MVDAVMMSSHGNPDAFSVWGGSVSTSDTIRFGKGDLEIFATHACHLLENSAAHPVGRWCGAFERLHYMCGFHNSSYSGGGQNARGQYFAMYVAWLHAVIPWMPQYTVREAWKMANVAVEGSDVEWAYLRCTGTGADTYNERLTTSEPADPTTDLGQQVADRQHVTGGVVQAHRVSLRGGRLRTGRFSGRRTHAHWGAFPRRGRRKLAMEGRFIAEPSIAMAMPSISVVRVLAALLFVGCVQAGVSDTTSFETERRALMREIERDVRETAEYLNRRELDERVMAAMASVPRHEFVRPEDRDLAYANRPLPIGYGQTISQPYIVAVMTDLLEPAKGCRALEVGTGSGYQAAVLSLLCEKVYTLEIVEGLGQQARARLARLGYTNVDVRISDGYFGWPEAAPFDVIVVTAVAGHIPPPLLKQLKPGGRMVLPVGTRFTTQQLVLVRKLDDGRITTRQMLPVAFVPLTGGHD